MSRAGCWRPLGGCGEAVLQRVERIALIAFHLQQIVATAAANQLGQGTLGEDRIPGEQSQHRVGVEQFCQMPPQQRRFVGLLSPGRPLADDRLQIMHEHVEHVQRIAVVVEPALGRLAVDGDDALGGFVGQTRLQLVIQRLLKLSHATLG